MFRKILPIIAILLVIALAISNYFNEPESENTVMTTKKGYLILGHYQNKFLTYIKLDTMQAYGTEGGDS